jgi:hypothetical protein
MSGFYISGEVIRIDPGQTPAINLRVARIATGNLRP